MSYPPSNPIQLLTLSFNLPLRHAEIRRWRGAFNEMAQESNSDLWHNHNNKKQEKAALHYRHPRIQYRVKGKKASILAINEGIDSVHDLLANHDLQVRWKDEPKSLQIVRTTSITESFEILDQPIAYRIYNWIALNQTNALRWQQCNSLLQRAALLERILAAQFIALFTAFNWRLPARLEVSLQDIHDKHTSRSTYAKGESLLVFDVSFNANVYIPKGLAIGRSISLGFGEVKKGISIS